MRRLALVLGVLVITVVPILAQPFAAPVARAVRDVANGTRRLAGSMIGTYLAFTGSGTGFTGSIASSPPAGGVDQILYRDDVGVLAMRSWAVAQTQWYANFTDLNNNTNVVLIPQVAGAFTNLQTHTLTGGSNAVSAGFCLQTNANTANRWCIGATATNAGDLMRGSTPSVVDPTGVPTISSGFGTSPSITGRHYAFRVTIGNPAASTGLVAISHTFTNTPTCMAVDETTAGGNPVRATPGTGQVTLTSVGTFVAGDTIGVLCRGF